MQKSSKTRYLLSPAWANIVTSSQHLPVWTVLAWLKRGKLLVRLTDVLFAASWVKTHLNNYKSSSLSSFWQVLSGLIFFTIFSTLSTMWFIDSSWLEGILKGHLVQPPWSEQGDLWRDQAAKGHIKSLGMGLQPHPWQSCSMILALSLQRTSSSCPN